MAEAITVIQMQKNKQHKSLDIALTTYCLSLNVEPSWKGAPPLFNKVALPIGISLRGYISFSAGEEAKSSFSFISCSRKHSVFGLSHILSGIQTYLLHDQYWSAFQSYDLMGWIWVN